MSDKNDFILEMAFRAYVAGEYARSIVEESDITFKKFRDQAIEAGLGDMLWEKIAEWEDKNG